MIGEVARMPAAVTCGTEAAPVDTRSAASATAWSEPAARTTRATRKPARPAWTANGAAGPARTTNGTARTTWATNGTARTTLTANGATLTATSTEITPTLATATARYRARSRTVPPALLTLPPLPPLNLDDRGTSLIAHHALVRGKNRGVR
jgi:hypothetical protein